MKIEYRETVLDFLSKMNKVYFVYGYYGVGGAQRRVANLANEMISHGFSIEIVATDGSNGSIKEDNYYGLKKGIGLTLIPEYSVLSNPDKSVGAVIKRIDKRIRRLKRVRYVCSKFLKRHDNLDDLIRGTKKSQQLRAFFETHEKGIVICFGFNIYEKVYYALDGLGYKLIYAETNAKEKYIEENNFESTMKLLNKADSWVFQTSEERDFFGLRNSDLAYIVYNPLNADLPSPSDKARQKTIVDFCAMKPHKNLMLLVRSFDRLCAEFPEYKLLLYIDYPGSEGNKCKEEIVQYSREHHLENNILILPMTPDIHNEIIDAGMFVSSSDYEGLSNSMLEAMAIGLPCVCTDCSGGGAREMIKNEWNGLLVPRGNEEELYKAMKRFITDRALAEKCGKNASLIREQLKIDVITNRWISIINRLYQN